MRKLLFLALFIPLMSCQYMEDVEGYALAEKLIASDSTETHTCDSCKCPTFYKDLKVVVWQGHSIGDGRGEVISVVPDSTLWLASRTGLAIEMVTTQSTSNDGDYGSTARNFSVKHKEYFGGGILLVNGCSGGAYAVSTPSTGNDWSATGKLWQKSITAGRNALNLVQQDSLYAIVIDLGINDINVNRNYATIKAAYQDLIDRDQAEFPGVPIVISQAGKTGTIGNGTLAYDLRRLIIELANENSNVSIAMSDAMFVGPDWMVDSTHPNAAAHDVKGASLAQWFKNRSLGYSKWANAVISTHFDELTPGRKNLLATFIDSQVSNGNFFKLERLLNFKTSQKENIFCDWSLMGYTSQSKIVYNANTDIQNGTGAYYITYVTPSIYVGRSAPDNFITGVKLRAKTTNLTTVASLFGGSDATARLSVQQTGTGLAFYANDLTATTALTSDVGFLAGNTYTVYRNGGEKGLKKNLVTEATASIPVVSGVTSAITVGGLRTGSSMSQYYFGNYEYYFDAAYTDFDFTSFYNGMEAVMAGW